MRLQTATIAGMLLAACAVSGWSADDVEGDKGLASRYPGDVGIARDRAVVFADDFEKWGRDAKDHGRWTGMHGKRSSLTGTADGKVKVSGRDGPGKRVLSVRCWHAGGGDTSGGVQLHLGNYAGRDRDLGGGYDDLYVRYYVRFDPTYRPIANHGANLGGRDLSRPGAYWVGQAGVRDVASRRYFFSGLQPSRSRRGRDFHFHFYSYHMDKRGPWGDVYPIQKVVPIRVGEWYCVERHMKLNSLNPLKADGLEELWVDGVLSIQRDHLRFRKIATLRITFFSLGTYYHRPGREWTREHPVRVDFDHVVIAKQYIGPLVVGKEKKKKEKGKGTDSPGSGSFVLPPGWKPDGK